MISLPQQWENPGAYERPDISEKTNAGSGKESDPLTSIQLADSILSIAHILVLDEGCIGHNFYQITRFCYAIRAM